MAQLSILSGYGTTASTGTEIDAGVDPGFASVTDTMQLAWRKFTNLWNNFIRNCFFDDGNLIEDEDVSDFTPPQQRTLVAISTLPCFLLMLGVLICYLCCRKRRQVPKYISGHFPLYDGTNSHASSPVAERRTLNTNIVSYGRVYDTDPEDHCNCKA